jgi:hypothetical protein
MVSEKNVESLRSEIAAVVGMEDTAIIFDLFGNSTYKFKHVDGTLVLPMHMGGGGTISLVTSSWTTTERMVI